MYLTPELQQELDERLQGLQELEVQDPAFVDLPMVDRVALLGLFIGSLVGLWVLFG